MSLLILRAILPRLRWGTPARLGRSLLTLGTALGLAVGLMGLVMRAVVGLAE